MKRLILITAAFILAVATIVIAEVGFVDFRNITQLRTGTHEASIQRKINGIVAIQPSSACTAYLNLSTTARSKAGVGYPIAANAEYKFNIPQTSTLTFLCATSAALKYVYIVR